MAPCRPRSPRATRPRRRRPPRGGAGRAGPSSVRVLRARAVLHGALRLLRLQHLHGRGPRPERPRSAARRGRRTPRPPSTRSGSRAGCSATSTCPCRRSSSAAGRRPCCAPGELGSVLAAIAAEFGLAPDVEVTTEANPDSVALWDLEELRQVGFDRISFGMQSDVPHVLATLDRTHDPLRVPAVVGWARKAGFEQVSLDLIYGTPGESLADWEASLDAALACAPDHVSAYSLIVEEGTALARRIARGELPMPDEDDLADKYLLADERLTKAGLRLVRGVQLGPRPGRAVPAQPRLLDRRRLVGRRPRRALPRRRRAVVERQAPRGVRRPDQRRGQPGARARGARRRDPAGRAGAARDAAARRACPCRCWTPPDARRSTTWSAAACSSASASGWC